MAKLIDLPDELLTLIFREFLSETLTDHVYLCEWEVEEDALSNRANLYQLSMVCRRVSKIALPLLYEQLFHDDDIERCITSVSRSKSLADWLGQTRYLHIEINNVNARIKAEMLMEAVLSNFTRFSQLQHLKLHIEQADSTTVAFVQSLGSTATGRHLQSLRLNVDWDDGQPVILRDLCPFRSLTGLHFHLEDLGVDVRSLPSLEDLKELSLDYFDEADDVLTTMSIAAPAVLRRLSIRLLAGAVPDVLSRIVGLHQWTSLEHLHYSDNTGSSYGTLLHEGGRLPALRHFRLDFNYHQSSESTTWVLPAGLHSFHAEGIVALGTLVHILSLIVDGSWLVYPMRVIRFEIIAHRGFARSAPDSKHSVLALAEEAILAARSKGVVLEPANLVERLGATELWEQSAQIGST